MAVQILGGISARLFDDIKTLRVDGRAATLLDATGAVLVDSVQTLPPVITEQPQILPASAGPGDSVTLSLGTASGQPAPQPIWDFTRDGVSIRGGVDSFMAIELPGPGLYELSVRWENGAGPAAVATTAQLQVQLPTLPAPPIDYAQVALAYIDAQTPISGTDTDVTAVNALGTGALRLVKTGSGAAIRRTAAGFVFADGAYLQSQTLSGQPTTDGLFAVIDFTLDSYGSSVGQLLDGGGGHVKFRNNAGNLQTVGQDDTSVALNLGGTVYGQRMVLAAQIDDVQDLLSAITPAGTEISVPHPGLSDPAITRASMGRYLIGTIHRLVIVGRAEGAGWPVTMAEVVADFRRGGVTAPAATVTSLELMPTYGQSENRPTASDLAATIDAATSGQVFYTFGLATESGTPVGPDGAGLVALDQTRQAAGFMVANGLGRVSPAYTMQHARAATWRQEGQTARGVLIADHGFGGQAIERWNPADASPIGRNQLHWMRETARLAADAGILATCPYVWLFQGTSAKNQEGPAYRAAFEAAHAAVTAEAARLFGAAPRLMVVVNGADVNTIGDRYDTPGVQYRLAVDNDGIIGTWQRLFPIRDRNIHLGPESQILVGETCAWAASEVESGAAWNITYSVAKSGRTVTVDFALRPGETLMERAGLYADYGGAATCAYFGFEAQGGIVDAVADLHGNRVTLTLATPEAGWFRLAHQVQDCSDMTDANGMTMSAHRSTLFGSHTRPSRFLPGQTLWRPVPGFRGRFVGDQFLPEG